MIAHHTRALVCSFRNGLARIVGRAPANAGRLAARHRGTRFGRTPSLSAAQQAGLGDICGPEKKRQIFGPHLSGQSHEHCAAGTGARCASHALEPRFTL